MLQSSRHLLLVEDNADDEELTLMALRGAGVGCDIHVARDGVEAMAHLFGTAPDFRAAHPLPRIVLLDLQLPRVDGFTLLERIRADSRTKAVPVVVLTSSDSNEDIVRSYNLGVNSFVKKPVEFDEFIESVGHLGIYWSRFNRVTREGGVHE